MRVIWALIGILALVALFFVGMAWRNVRVATNTMYSPSGIKTDLPKKLAAKKPINVLLLGDRYRGARPFLQGADGYDHDDDRQPATKEDDDR